MGQKFSEFKKKTKMDEKIEGIILSGINSTIDESDRSICNNNFVNNQLSDDNGNNTVSLTSTSDQHTADQLNSINGNFCDNRAAETNDNTSNLKNDPATHSSSQVSHSYESPNVNKIIEDTSKKLVLQIKSEANVRKTQKSSKDPCSSNQQKKKWNRWVLKFNCTRPKSSGTNAGVSSNDIPEDVSGCDSCVCTGYERTESEAVRDDFFVESTSGTGTEDDRNSDEDRGSTAEPVIDLAKFRPENYPIEDCDERARKERAREIAEGVEPPPGYRSHIQLVYPEQLSSALDSFTAFLQTAAFAALTQMDIPQAHTQVDYMHCLVPDLLQITSCSFYWGKMDRYEAERLLEGLPEGAFLLRDSAQEEYLFSVSFRKYSRSLHARIEQWNHRFSFDCHDPGVFASSTVCGLLEHYKDPTCCMFFEPVLTIPLHRNFTFPLQHLCRATICSQISYDGINQLHLPKTLKAYLKEYHYRQRLRVRVLDSEQ